MTMLQGTGRQGDFVHQTQTMGKDFKNVSKKWLDQCQPIDKAIEQLVAGHAQTEDFLATVGQMQCALDEQGSFVVQHEDGRQFRPTPYAVDQMAKWANVGSWYASSLLQDPKDHRGKQVFARDRGDAEALMVAFRNGFRRIDPDKAFLWRTRQDGTLRSMLSDQYTAINNEWFMESIKRIIPGGMVSHWRGDTDTLWGNILIPDTLRAEDDSDYGGMLSIGNSEIGERKLYSSPSVFRAICQNGCIWDQTKGEKLAIRHRGEINLVELFAQIEHNLASQIALVPRGIEQLLTAKRLEWDDKNVFPLFAQVSKQFKLSKRQAVETYAAYKVEKEVVGPLANTLFGVINSLTRAGQKLSNTEWVQLDTIGGELASFDADDWSNLTRRAKMLKASEIDEIFALAN